MIFLMGASFTSGELQNYGLNSLGMGGYHDNKAQYYKFDY